jgi:hypothetical protein
MEIRKALIQRGAVDVIVTTISNMFDTVILLKKAKIHRKALQMRDGMKAEFRVELLNAFNGRLLVGLTQARSTRISRGSRA